MASRQKIMFLAGRWCVVASLISIALFSSGLADILIKGEKNYNYEYNITNIKDYPDYVFLTSSVIHRWQYTSIINSTTGLFGGGYKLDSFRLHAAAASDFDKELFFRQRDQYNPESVNCTEYCQNNTQIATSNLTFPVAISLNESMGVDRIDVYLKIDDITNESLNISRTRTQYYYQNGTVEELSPEEA
jgi:hypothetical protein